MANNVGRYFQNARLNWMRGTSYPATQGQVWAALLTTLPTDNAGTGLVEVSGGSYARAAIQTVLAAPAAPSVAGSGTGSTVAAGTYKVVVTYVNVDGETVASAESSVTTTSGQNIVITSPASVAGATGWYAYVTQVGGATGTETRQQAAGSPTAIGTNLTISAPPTSNGAAEPGANTTYGFSAPSTSGSLQQMNNNAVVGFPTASANWGTIVGVAIYDASSAGNLLYFAPLAASQVVNNTQTFSFLAGALVIQED